MTYSTLPKSGLRVADDYGHADWLSDIMNYNIARLNTTLLKLHGLLDVDVTGINDGDILTYNSATSKFEVETPLWTGTEITTTTTTTTV